MKRVRVGVIGCGNVLSAYRVPLQSLSAAGRVEIVAACGRESQREETLHAIGPCRFSLREEDLLDANDIHAVVILTSMPSHGRLARAALESGKHVLVEKPMATGLDEATSLVALAESKRLQFACAPFTVLSPTFRSLSSRIARGDIGTPTLARSRYGWSGPWWNPWFYVEGGGCLFDLGVYGLTTLTGLLGPVRSVTAMTGIAIPQRLVEGKPVAVTVEDHAQVIVEFERGGLGNIMTGFTMQQYRSPAIEIYGTEGTLQMLGDDWDPDGYELWANRAGCWQVFKETEPDWPWTAGLAHWIDTIQNGGELVYSSRHALHVLELMIRARESAREGRRTEITSRFIPPRAEDEVPPPEAHRVHDRTRGKH